MKLGILIAVLSLLAPVAHAGPYGKIRAGHAQSELFVDHAILGVQHSLDDKYSADLAVDAASPVLLYSASLKGSGVLLKGDTAEVGLRALNYVAQMESKLGTSWVVPSVAEQIGLVAVRDSSISYGAKAGAFGGAMEVQDGVKGDKKNTYGVLAHYDVLQNVQVIAMSQKDMAAKVDSHAISVVGSLAKVPHLGKAVVAVELGKKQAEAMEDQNTVGVTATLGVTEKVSLVGQCIMGNDAFQAASGIKHLGAVGVTTTLGKGIKAALVGSEAIAADEQKNQSLALKLAADL